MRPERISDLRWKDIMSSLIVDCFALEIEEGFEAPVDQPVATLGILEVDDCRRVIQNRLELLLARP